MLRIFTDFYPFGQSPLGEAVLIRETRGYPCPDFKLLGSQAMTHTPLQFAIRNPRSNSR